MAIILLLMALDLKFLLIPGSNKGVDNLAEAVTVARASAYSYVVQRFAKENAQSSLLGDTDDIRSSEYINVHVYIKHPFGTGARASRKLQVQ